MIAHRATLDVSRALVHHLARLLHNERRLRAIPAGSRALRPAPLADNGYDGTGIGNHTPIKQPEGNQTLSPDNRTHNRLPRALRCLGERGSALLKGRWRTLQHITVSPSRIGDIARAAPVLTRFEHGYLREIR